MPKTVRKKAVQQPSGLSLEDLENKIIGAFGGLEKVRFSDGGLIVSDTEQRSSLCFQPTNPCKADCLSTVKVTPENHVQELFDLLGVPLELRGALRELFFSNPSLVLAQVAQGWCICQDPGADVSDKPEVPALLLVPNQARRKFSLALYGPDILRDVSV